jgi:hypothetical protein
MPNQLIACISLPPVTVTSVPISDYAEANDMLAKLDTEAYFPCCGKFVCGGCVQSFGESRIINCPHCKTQGTNKTDEEAVEELKKRFEANDASAILALGNSYHNGLLGLQHDREKAIELWKQAVLSPPPTTVGRVISHMDPTRHLRYVHRLTYLR